MHLKSTLNFCFILITLSILGRLYFLGSYDLLVEEAYYWNYSQHLALGYLDHPPMVAWLIKASTLLFGTNEFAVRFPSLLCWGIAALFSFKLTRLINRDASQYAVFLLSILPCFFLQSLVMTPDQPLLLCWSAALYYLYRAILLEESSSWYAAGFWLGCGLLSKYSIVLLGPVTLLYLVCVPAARFWLTRKEPYLCACIALLLFTPVIYWNATHEWASFIFQSSRRFQDHYHFTFHLFLLVLVVSLLPLGVWGLIKLLKKNSLNSDLIDKQSLRFLQIYTLVPLLFFGVFSLTHQIKLNWLSPILLAFIPWLAIQITHRHRIVWTAASLMLTLTYATLALLLINPPITFPPKYQTKLIAWDKFTAEIHAISKQIEANEHSVPALLPLDTFNIASELAFYQQKLITQHEIDKAYPTLGFHILGGDSLAYNYWSKKEDYLGKIVVFIAKNRDQFDNKLFNNKITALTSPKPIWSYSQNNRTKVHAYYYQIVRLNA